MVCEDRQRGVQDRPCARRGIVCQRPQPVKVLGTYAFGGPGGGFTGEHPQARELLSVIPGSRMVDVADAGHMVAGDDNDVFSAAVEGLLRNLEPHT
jgi:pimeloyl-ACP methyl ester carboxylesterase